MAESNLDPDAMSAPPDRSVGLFQLMAGGLGAGHGVAEHQDPAANISIMVSAVQKSEAFASAASLQDAVSVFVRTLMPPRPTLQSEIVNRVTTAERLAQTSRSRRAVCRRA
jgi:hypothetical protein